MNISSPMSTTTISTTTTTENPTTVYSPTEINGTMFWFVKRKLNYGEAIINCNENGGKLFEPGMPIQIFWFIKWLKRPLIMLNEYGLV